MIPRDKICCFTGHRNLPARTLPDLKRRLADAIELLIGQASAVLPRAGRGALTPWPPGRY